MITTIIFSYNRAMQLELLLDSILKHDTLKLLNVHVLYSTSSLQYEKGYEILKNKYTFLTWYKEKTFNKKFVWPFLPPYWRNYYWWLKHNYNRNVQSNFKKLLISILKASKKETVMFLTDDSLFTENIFINKTILREIVDNGTLNSYSLRHGVNIWGGNFKEFNNYIKWDISHIHKHSEWHYPFSVDGHIYNKEVLIEIFRKVWFKNPNTMEGNVATYVKDKKLFSQMSANIQGSLLGFELNRVQTISENNNLDISSGTMNELYMNGYQLELKYAMLDSHLFRPELMKVFVVKNDDIITLYEQKK